MASVNVAADQRIDRADVQARGAADALENLFELPVLRRLQAAVVEKDDMHLPDLFHPAVPLSDHHGRRPSHQGHIARHELGRGPPGQELQDQRRVGDLGNQLFVTYDHHVDRGQGGDEAGVPLVRDQPDRSVFRDSEVCPGNPHVGIDKLPTQPLARGLDHEGDVRRDLLVELPGEVIRDLITAQVNGGHHHVGRPVSGQLDNPLSEVRFADVQPLFLEIGTEIDLLGSHGFGLDNSLYAPCATEIH